VLPPTPPPTQRPACTPRESRGGHGRATGDGGVVHAYCTCSDVRGSGAARVVWRRGAAAARLRAPRRCLWRRWRPYPLPSIPSIPPAPPRTASGAASAAVPPPSLRSSQPPWRPPAPPHGGDGGAGHDTRRVGRRVVRRRRSRRVGCVLFLCGACHAPAFWGSMLRGCSLRFAPSLFVKMGHAEVDQRADHRR